MVEHKSDIDRWRTDRFAEMTSIMNGYTDLSAYLEADRSPSSKAVANHIGLVQHLVLGESICWPDVGLTATIQQGAKPLRVQDSYGILQERAHAAEASEGEVMIYPRGLIESLRFRSPPPLEQRKAILAKNVGGAATRDPITILR